MVRRSLPYNNPELPLNKLLHDSARATLILQVSLLIKHTQILNHKLGVNLTE